MNTQNNINFASVNGVISNLQDACINLSDRGLLFGHALFETLLVQNKTMHQWDEHYQRLKTSCKKIHILCPKKNVLKQKCQDLIEHMSQATHEEYLNLKIIISGGSYSHLMIPQSQFSLMKPNIYILCQKAILLTPEQRLQGLKVKSMKDERGPFLKEIKSTDYLFNFLCLDIAQKEGYHDVLLHDEQGFLTEGITSSFMWFDHKKNIYFTPPKGNCLAGTSILKFIKKLKNQKISYQYQMLNKKEATNCIGCAMISSVRGLVFINQIDHVIFNLTNHLDFYKYLIETFYSCES